MHGRHQLGLDGHHLDPARIPRGDPCAQAPAPDGDEHGVEVGRVGIELATHGARARHGVDVIVRVHE